MKRTSMIFLLFAVLLLAGCDTELGHTDHDHDGDGEQDHAPEDHDEHEEEHHEEDHEEELIF